MKTEAALIFNGYDLENVLPGFLTLDTNGRENYTRKLELINTPRDGGILATNFLDPRTVVVNYFIHAKSKQELNTTFDKLKVLLQGKEVPFKFADELQYTRYGTVREFINSDPGKLETFGTITIEMDKPYKYSDLKTVTTSDGNLVINDASLVGTVKPERITITGSETPLVLIGIGQRIEFNIAYPATTTLIIDMLNNSVTRNGVNEYQHVTLRSNIADLKIYNKIQIRSTTYPNIKVEYRNEVI